MVKPLMLLLDDKGEGTTIIGGKTYRVVAVYEVSYGYGDERSLKFTVRLRESLDEEAQARRIKGLEAELERERERLEDIRAALGTGDDQ